MNVVEKTETYNAQYTSCKSYRRGLCNILLLRLACSLLQGIFEWDTALPHDEMKNCEINVVELSLLTVCIHRTNFSQHAACSDWTARCLCLHCFLSSASLFRVNLRVKASWDKAPALKLEHICIHAGIRHEVWPQICSNKASFKLCSKLAKY